jgi:transcriptional regulator with XRE-family HTH domain
MLKSGRSQRDLARASGLDPGQLSRFETGRRTLTLPMAGKLAGVLDLELGPCREPAEPEPTNRAAPLAGIAGIASLLRGHAKKVDRGKPVSAATLRRLADRLGAELGELAKKLEKVSK